MKKNSFTLVELLIVIIIIGILATMAVPQYQKMVNRAKWTECVSLAAAIKTAELLYYAENGVYRTGGSVNLSSLSMLDMPAVANRKFVFTIRIANMVYGIPQPRRADDNFGQTAIDEGPYFSLNYANNTTSYGNGAPGSL